MNAGLALEKLKKALVGGIFIAGILLSAAPHTAHAGFAVQPTVLYLAEPGAVAVLFLENNTKTANVYQVGGAEWTDRASPTSVGPTRDLAISPRVLRLGPGETGRVRVRAAHPGIAGSGKAYRILARQVAPKRPDGDLSVNIEIQFNVPLLTKRE